MAPSWHINPSSPKYLQRQLLRKRSFILFLISIKYISFFFSESSPRVFIYAISQFSSRTNKRKQSISRRDSLARPAQHEDQFDIHSHISNKNWAPSVRDHIYTKITCLQREVTNCCLCTKKKKKMLQMATPVMIGRIKDAI